MRMSILPKCLPGWWSVGLCISIMLLFALSVVILGPGPDYNRPLAYTLTFVIAGISIAAFITGLLNSIKTKERSVLVFAAMAIGLYNLIGCVTSLLGLQR
jgi:hypothetical protein